MEAYKYKIKRKITMKIIQKSMKIIGVLIVLFLFVGCKADSIPCRSVPQGDYVLVK
jgi:uncharacterized lipoprotein YajG